MNHLYLLCLKIRQLTNLKLWIWKIIDSFSYHLLTSPLKEIVNSDGWRDCWADRLEDSLSLQIAWFYPRINFKAPASTITSAEHVLLPQQLCCLPLLGYLDCSNLLSDFPPRLQQLTSLQCMKLKPNKMSSFPVFLVPPTFTLLDLRNPLTKVPRGSQVSCNATLESTDISDIPTLKHLGVIFPTRSFLVFI